MRIASRSESGCGLVRVDLKSEWEQAMKLSKPAIASAAGAVLVGAIILLLINVHQPRRISATFDPPYPEANADGDSIRAVLEGRIPCGMADCARLKVQLVLYESRTEKIPTTYWLGLIGTNGNDRVVRQGTWSVRTGVEGYSEALVYALDDRADETLRYYWRVNDNILLVLDEHMSPRVGNAAWGYMLSRYDAPYGPRTYIYSR
jgi:hypothetical protein